MAQLTMSREASSCGSDNSIRPEAPCHAKRVPILILRKRMLGHEIIGHVQAK